MTAIRFLVIGALLLSATASATLAGPAQDRQVGNILYAIPPGWVGVGNPQIVALAPEAQARQAQVSTYMALINATDIERDAKLMRQPFKAFCASVGYALAVADLGADALASEPRILSDPDRRIEACVIDARAGRAGNMLLSRYVPVRVSGRVAIALLKVAGSDRDFGPAAGDFDKLLESMTFANLGHRLARPARPLPASFTAYAPAPKPAPPPRAGGRRCTTRQQCTFNMWGGSSFPSYSCLPVPRC
ncbi:hypothetical protein OF829_12415 [Sphingomonas sp. LB-2]|uniref:hypothetical protein n=1 Tax=Sphingomonas caeni TaxID=2984949 RepID=UPI00222E1E2C|nr:hypothetical protein [Sphingomonas caeni]MCW3848045.1 hypothetical protein [Sphingomonas caeni]